ncbi:prolyl aminopeptidase-like protein [Xylariaceae sp. FL1272]|nr:prolyl aminopeptidase-like protein [Xylariaceae sp. FL1272]
MTFPFNVIEHVIPAQHLREWPQATAQSAEDVYRSTSSRISRTIILIVKNGDITIIAAHACGFPNEVYEPLWVELYAHCKMRGIRLRGIWVADAMNQGYSGHINEQLLGNDPSGNDVARDLLYMVNIFRSQMPKPIIGIGHSFGASVLTQLSLTHPSLFTTLVLLEPSISTLERNASVISVSQLLAVRRDVWPSRDAAGKSIRGSRLYSSLTYFRPLYPHIRADGTLDRSGAPDYDQATLGSPRQNDPFPLYRGEATMVFNQLPHVRPSVFWVFGSESGVNKHGRLRTKMVRSCGSSTGGSGGVVADRGAETSLNGYGHLLPMEAPSLCAEHTVKWIERELQLMPLVEKTMMDKQFLSAIKKPADDAKQVDVT